MVWVGGILNLIGLEGWCEASDKGHRVPGSRSVNVH